MHHLNTSNNMTSFESTSHDEPNIIFITMRLILSLLIIVVNTCIISIYCSRRRRTLTILPNRLLLSLSICELQTGFSILLNITCNMFRSETLIYRVLTDIYTTFLVKTVVLHLCGITLDRWLSLFYAMTYQSIVTKKFISRFVMISWGVPLFISILQFTWLHIVICKQPNEKLMVLVSRIEVWYSLLTFIFFVALPMVLLGTAFVAMIAEIRRLLHCTPGQHMMIAQLPRQRRVLYIFCAIYVTFLVLAMPYFALRLANDIHYWRDDDMHIDKSLVYFAILLKNLASAINPVLYASTTSKLCALAMRFPGNSTFKRARNQSWQTMRSFLLHKQNSVII